uniref:50S ribosomal protein L6 n=1 Tax=Nephromyces sp. ex Molgula occidentalis TaxID=2544991 RepID=A0A5C1H8J3_9APIC|nr:50S ribosomal protein L6 [Nephromyces sp. ex Molgula occidentalis]
MNLKLYKQSLNKNHLFNIIDKKTNLNILLIKKNNLFFNIYLLNNLFINLNFNYWILLKKNFKSFLILYINLIKKILYKNIINYEKELIIKGLGFYFIKDTIKTNILKLNIGINYIINLKLPLNIEIKLKNNNTNLILKGTNINLINLISSRVKNLKPPEIYKEKGIYYFNEKLKKIFKNKKF